VYSLTAPFKNGVPSSNSSVANKMARIKSMSRFIGDMVARARAEFQRNSVGLRVGQDEFEGSLASDPGNWSILIILGDG
jgi:hypothetical protein